MSFNKTAFKIVSFSEKGHNRQYWLSRPVIERLAAAWKLTCVVYNMPYSIDHKMGRTVFKMYKRCDE